MRKTEREEGGEIIRERGQTERDLVREETQTETETDRGREKEREREGGQTEREAEREREHSDAGEKMYKTKLGIRTKNIEGFSARRTALTEDG